MHHTKVATLLLLATSCAGDTTPAATGPVTPVRRFFMVTNQLAAPVTISIDDTVALVLLGGGSGGIAALTTAQWLTWTSAKPTDTTGTPVPDDIGTVRIAVSGISDSLQITNVIDDTTYVTPQFFNTTSAKVAIGVSEVSTNATVSCAAALWPEVDGTEGYTRIGYYRLVAGTEVRAYRDGSRCTGPYVAWPAEQLSKFTPKSGVVSLTLSVAP